MGTGVCAVSVTGPQQVRILIKRVRDEFPSLHSSICKAIHFSLYGVWLREILSALTSSLLSIAIIPKFKWKFRGLNRQERLIYGICHH